jgi:hypothetical protein
MQQLKDGGERDGNKNEEHLWQLKAFKPEKLLLFPRSSVCECVFVLMLKSRFLFGGY